MMHGIDGQVDAVYNFVIQKGGRWYGAQTGHLNRVASS